MITDDLNRRRHRQTEDEIRRAALTLFEERGVDGTTVEDIATAAGVSPRTVFRYTATKERAALLPDPKIARAIDEALDDLSTDEPLIPQLMEVWRGLLRAIEQDDSDTGHDTVRQWRLMAREPRLVVAALALDQERLESAQERLAATLDLDPLTVRVVLITTSTLFRVAMDQWASETAPVGLVESFDAACEALLQHAGAGPTR